MKGDPLFNAVYRGIKAGITKTFDEKLLGSSLILIYTGIDTMAWLDMPPNQTGVTRRDFINWVEAYFDQRFLKQITGEELYSARCAVVHTYTVESSMTQSGTRVLLYKLGGTPPVNYVPAVAPDHVGLDMRYLKDTFFQAIDTFLMKAFADKKKGALIDQRAQKLLNVMPYEPSS